MYVRLINDVANADAISVYNRWIAALECSQIVDVQLFFFYSKLCTSMKVYELFVRNIMPEKCFKCGCLYDCTLVCRKNSIH